MANNSSALLEAHGVSKYFPVRGRLLGKDVVKAVDDVSFRIENGEALVLMGESGCGKTTCGLTVIRLCEPTSGEVTLGGVELFSLGRHALRDVRRDVQVVLQNPLASLDPRITARRAIAEPMVIQRRHLSLQRKEVASKVSGLAQIVGLREEDLDKYPRDLSGGQQQRVCICRALALGPRFLVMDEPTSSLDVSVQARVLNLILDLREQFGLTYLFITHDAAVARYVGDRVAIMYLGQIVEVGSINKVFEDRLHPYTRALLQSVLTPQSVLGETEVLLEGTPEKAVNLPEGCIFQRRCRAVGDECLPCRPELLEIRSGHFVRCHNLTVSSSKLETASLDTSEAREPRTPLAEGGYSA
ncbi:oligopeptide/dipeptide ABC transporter ATP-binding protein [Candidatus Bipolaricaulota bacterium]